jgi:hypothetical protein
MFRDVVYAIRDPYGNRPLCIGRIVPISKLQSSGEDLSIPFSPKKELWVAWNAKFYQVALLLCGSNRHTYVGAISEPL